MVRAILLLTTLALALGCGSKEEEAAELKAYVLQIKKFESYNERVEQTIVRFDDPTQDITREDILAARALLRDYAADVQAVTPPTETQAKNTHGLYARTFDDASQMANDETGDIRRQSQSVAIGMRNLRRAVEDRVYPSFGVLLARYELVGEDYELSWPQSD